MFSEVTLNGDLTQATFGYHPNELSPTSHAKVVVVCNGCQKAIHREMRHVCKKHQCPSQVGDRRRCYKCGDWKDVSFFNRSCRDGKPAKLCRECYNKHPAVVKCELRRRSRLRGSFENDLALYFRKRVDAVRNQCKHRGIVFDLDAEFLLGLWRSQNGKCYYSGIPMKREKKQLGFQCWDAPSIDRKVPSLGYTKDNVVLCCFAVNSFKQSLDEKQFAEMVKNAKWWCFEEK